MGCRDGINWFYRLSNVFRHLSSLSVIYQIFPVAHLRPDFQTCLERLRIKSLKYKLLDPFHLLLLTWFPLQHELTILKWDFQRLTQTTFPFLLFSVTRRSRSDESHSLTSQVPRPTYYWISSQLENLTTDWLTHSLTHSLMVSWLNWCDSGEWGYL